MVRRVGNPYKRLRVPQSRKSGSRGTKISRILALRDITTEAKNVPCGICEKRYPYYVMDFDHLDPEKKKYTISKLVQNARCSEETLRAEIAKCRVLCANCHRQVTHDQAVERKGKWRTTKRKKSKSSITDTSST